MSTNPAGEIQATPLGQRAEGAAHGTLREPVGKRSPILGYNHNVRYRGLVFHVQTEDSGVLSPHLFTHLFHSGVIVSTRKYVYDSDSTEDVIQDIIAANGTRVWSHFDGRLAIVDVGLKIKKISRINDRLRAQRQSKAR